MRAYARFGITLAVSFVLMFALSMMMINQWDHFYWNLSNAYMALTMVAVMGVVMLIAMWGTMFKDRRVNIGLLVGLAAAAVILFVMGRQSTFIDDTRFMQSMIPHHSRAIQICQQAQLTDPEVQSLCQEIIDSQRREITEMQAILDRGAR